MIVRVLEELIAGFEKYLATQARTSDEPLLFYENTQHFQKNWAEPVNALPDTLKRAVYNTQSKRFWYKPREILIAFASFNEEFTGLMLRDLFNETKALSGRIERFKYYCDTLLGELQEMDRKFPSDHFQTTEVIYFYLAMRFPEEYAVYQHKHFVKTLVLLSAKDIPVVFDPERFYKSAKIFNKYLKDNPLIDKHIEALLKGTNTFGLQNMLRVTYFCWYCDNIHNNT